MDLRDRICVQSTIPQDPLGVTTPTTPLTRGLLMIPRDPLIATTPTTSLSLEVHSPSLKIHLKPQHLTPEVHSQRVTRTVITPNHWKHSRLKETYS